jgi:sporulation protein YlmC with PRC-barrel domain
VAQQTTTINRGQTASAGQLDTKMRGSNVRASQLIGMSIQNPQGKNVGQINDLVVDTMTGKIRYAAVTYGGFLGIGNKMFAVPFEAFKTKVDPNDNDETVLMLDVTQQQLEGSVGFDESSWPDFADVKFTTELDTRYKVNRDTHERSGKVDVEVDRDGLDVDVDTDRNDK